MNMGYIIRHCQESNSQPVPSQAGVDTTRPQWRTYAVKPEKIERLIREWFESDSRVIGLTYIRVTIEYGCTVDWWTRDKK